MKSQRLDYNRFAEVLSERGLVDPTALQHILEQTCQTGELFPEVLVRDGLVADWELSRVASEAFHVVFLPLDVYSPSKAALELCDPTFLHQQCLVPLDVYGEMLTVAMPAMTTSEVLNSLGEKVGKKVHPVVGTAASNRRWLEENLPALKNSTVDAVAGALPGVSSDWSAVFDEGDAAVLMDLQTDGDDGDEAQGADEPDAEETAAKDLDLSGLEDLDDLLS